MFRPQSDILYGAFLQTYSKPPTFYAKAPPWSYHRVLNTPLEVFLQDAPRKQLAIAAVEKCLTTTAWQSYY